MRPLTFEPSIPLALWTTLAVAAAALLATYSWASRRRLTGRRRGPVLVLMALVTVLPLVILLNPTWLGRVAPPAGKPIITLLVDRSASMATTDVGGKPRYVAASELASTMSQQLGERYEVRLRQFAGESAATTREQLPRLAADGAATDVARAIEDALEPECPQGQAILLLSDGIHNAGGGAARLRQAADKAKALAVPVYAKTFGGKGGVQDVAVELALAQELAFVGQRLPIVVGLRQRGALGRRTALALLLDGKPLERREVELQPDGLAEVTLTLPARAPGLYRYEVRADTLPGEVTALNNTATLLVRVVDQPIRVLLLEGKPYWDTKFLIRTLSTDPSIALVSMVQMAPGRVLQRKVARATSKDAAATSPVESKASSPDPRSDEWTVRQDAANVLAATDGLAPYQILILGRGSEAFLGDQSLARMKKWIASGDGSLVCFRGAPSSAISQRLGELMPVRWTPAGESRFRVQWTSLGQSLRWLPPGQEAGEELGVLPSLARSTRPERPSPLAIVLAKTAAGDPSAEEPVISYQPVGSGRVVVLEGAGMWRWAFLPPAYQKYDDTYGVLWRSMIRWLMANVGLLPNESMMLRPDKVTFSTQETATATLLVRAGTHSGKTPSVALAGIGAAASKTVAAEPSGSDPGQFRVVFGRLPEGSYSARVVETGSAAAGSARFDVRGPLAERLDVQAAPELMQQIAERSQGAMLEGSDPESLARRFDEDRARSRPERTVRHTAWDRWWVLAGVLAVWGVAWGLRRNTGLV